jgi:Flp pilus assembly protein TadG
MKMNSKGQALVEFALAALVFFAVLFAIIDLGMMFYVNLTMQHAVREGTRFAITGQPAPAVGSPPPTGAERKAAMIQTMKNSSVGLYDKNLNA